MAEVDIARVANHQVQIAGQDDGHRDQNKIFAQRNIIGVQWKPHEDRGQKQNQPEQWAAQDHAVCLPKMPRGKTISTTTNRPNSISGIQLTAMKGDTAPSSNPSNTPASRAPKGLPNPASTVTTKLFN